MTTFRSVHANPEASTGLMLWRVTNSWQRAIRAALEPYGLTHVQFVLLAVLTAVDRTAAVTQRDLAEYAGTDTMMTSQVLRALEAKGLVQRHAHPTDGRARRLTPTADGIELVNRANAQVERTDRDYFGPLGTGIPEFTRSLGVLLRNGT